MEKIKAVVLSNGELKVEEIENTLENLQKIVGGYIEMPVLNKVLHSNKINAIINEEGKYIEELRPEIALINSSTNKILDIVYGNCIFTSYDVEGNTIGLNDEQIEIIMEELSGEAVLTYQDSGKEIVTKTMFL